MNIASTDRRRERGGMGAPEASPATFAAQATAFAARFATGAAEHDRTGYPPLENFQALFPTGMLSLVVARNDGGFDGGLAEAQAVVGEIARGEPATALILAMHYAVHAGIARRLSWPEELARKLTRESLSGIALANALKVEPRAGSPSRGGLPDTVARRVSSGWSISGRKIYSTGSSILSWGIVSARTDEASPRIGTFAVPMHLHGVRIEETWNATGMRATASHDVVFDEVEIPFGHALELKPLAEGLARNEWVMAWYNGLIAAVYDGVARSARDWLVGFVQETVPTGLGAPLATLPRIHEAMGAIEILLATSRELLHGHARAVDGGNELDLGRSFVRQAVIDNAIRVTTYALELAGNHGLSRHNPLERHHRDALCGRAHAPQADVVRASIGRALLSAGPDR